MSGLTLLLVDDEPDVAELFESIVEDDFDCTVCTDPPAALTLLNDKAFDVVVTDLKMPEVSGDQIVAAAKKVASALGRSVKVFVSSGHSADDHLVKAALANGADGLISKPYTDFDAILAQLTGD